MEFEKQLRGALKVEDPGAEFTAKVLQQLDLPPAVVTAPRRRWRLPASLAAALLSVMVGLHWQDERQAQQRNLYASQQLAIALAITSSQLNAVQQRLAPDPRQPNHKLENGS